MADFDVEVDARGLYCPLPVLRLAKVLREKAPGTIALLYATDPAAVEDVRVFCREGAHELLDSGSEGSLFSFRVKKGR